MSVVEYLKVYSSVTSVTTKTPLYPTLSAPLVFELLVTFLIVTVSPTSTLCGSSETTVTVLVANEQDLINLGFLLYP